MGISAADGAQNWKQKYAESLDELERNREEWANREKLLCRATIRLTLATTGLDPVLDPHLTRIRDLLRKGMANERLLAELDAVSESLVRESKEEKKAVVVSLKDETQVLFRFLEQLAPDRAEKNALTRIEAKVQKGEVQTQEALFDSLQELLHNPISGSPVGEKKSGLLSRLFARRETSGLPDDRMDIETVRDRLFAMLEAIEVPLAFREKGEQLKQRIKAELQAEQLHGLLNEAIAFLSEVRTYILQEQKEIESFLAVLTGKLDELEHEVSGADARAQALVQDRQAEATSVEDQVAEFRSVALNATDLSQLKSLVVQRLDHLTGQLHISRERELDQLQKNQAQLGQLTKRLQDLEGETGDLRTKLHLAHDMALRDSLTGLPNRKAYEERLTQEIARWKRIHHPFALLVWDIDHFKCVNDRFGHSAGDKVLATVARELAHSIRETDFVARYGGEEFVMLLCGAEGETALRVAEHIRDKIAHCGFNSHGKPVPVTVSCGLSCFRAEDGAEILFERADQGLYQAKQEGRNRCVLR